MFCALRALSLVVSLATLIVFYAFFVSCRGTKSRRRRKRRRISRRPKTRARASRKEGRKRSGREEWKEEAKPKKKDPKGKAKTIVAEDDDDAFEEEVQQIKAEPAQMASQPRRAPSSTHLHGSAGGTTVTSGKCKQQQLQEWQQQEQHE